MPMGQIITALMSGPIIEYLNGDVASFFLWVASLHFLVLLVGSMLFFIEHLTDE